MGRSGKLTSGGDGGAGVEEEWGGTADCQWYFNCSCLSMASGRAVV